METTPIYDAVEAELDIHPADLVRPPWSFPLWDDLTGVPGPVASRP